MDIKQAEIKEVQSRLLEMLIFFHRYCEDHRLKYYLIGGSMLGAVRHSGFIPWDDDIDVGMPREDFDKLSNVFSNNGRFILETPHSLSNSCFPYSKLYDSTTTLIENTRYQLTRGLYIDIFPIDGCGNSEAEAITWCRKIGRRKLLLKLRNSPNKNDRGTIKNIGIAIVRILPRFIAGENILINQIEDLCKTYSFESSAFSGNLVGAWGSKEIMPTAFFGEPTLYSFENTKVYGVQMYDEYLSRVYGDWRKWPPEEKRVSHHDYISLDLNRPYR